MKYNCYRSFLRRRLEVIDELLEGSVDDEVDGVDVPLPVHPDIINETNMQAKTKLTTLFFMAASPCFIT